MDSIIEEMLKFLCGKDADAVFRTASGSTFCVKGKLHYEGNNTWKVQNIVYSDVFCIFNQDSVEKIHSETIYLK